MIINRLLSGSLAFIFNACELLSSKGNDDCEATRLKNTEEHVFSIQTDISDFIFFHSSVEYKVKNANQAFFSGSATKFYCSGKQGGSFDLRTTIYPSESTPEFLKELKIGGPYQIKFDNSRDYVNIIVRVKLRFLDGKTFECQDVVNEVYFKDIKMDPDDLHKYAEVSFKEANIFEVIN